MSTEAKLRLRRYPFFGVIALVAPLIGLLVAYAFPLNKGHSADDGMGNAIQVFGITLLGLAVGFVEALIAFARRERYWEIALVGLLLEGVLELYAH
jgi:hypothetical protein